jgi:hypothetical protein
VKINYKEIFLNHLVLLHQFIEKVEASAVNESTLLKARLVDDMFPLNVQTKIAANFALRACCPLAGRKYQELAGDIDSFQQLKAYVSSTIDYINQLSEPILAPLDLYVEDNAGLNEISLPAAEYVSSFVLPNFFFHISMVYAIAKSNGIAVTKGDFDGIHRYPNGFSWEAPSN